VREAYRKAAKEPKKKIGEKDLSMTARRDGWKISIEPREERGQIAGQGQREDIRLSTAMFLSPGSLFFTIVEAMLWAGGVWFCIQMLLRFREDLRKLREADEWAERLAIIFLWCLTGVVLLLCVRFAVGIGERIMQGLQSFR
jgi:hypothetical protein